jgi:hypothetical protein
LKGFSFTFLELPKFNIDIHNLSDITEKWMYFFKHAPDTSPENLRTLIGHDDIIERVYGELDRFYWNEEEVETYEQAEKYKDTLIATMDKEFDDGLKIGIERVAKNMLA